jgi:hypothetical protein
MLIFKSESQENIRDYPDGDSCHEKSDYQVHPFGGSTKSLTDLNKNGTGSAHKKGKNKQGKEIRDFQYIGKKELFFHIKKFRSGYSFIFKGKTVFYYLGFI